MSASGSTKTCPVVPSSAMVDAGGNGEHRRSRGHDGRDGARSGQDGAVAGRAAGGEHQAPDPGHVEVGDLGRREVVGDQDAVAFDVQRGGADEDARDLLPDVAYVGGAGAQVRVGHGRPAPPRPLTRRPARRVARSRPTRIRSWTSSSRSASSTSIRCASKIRASSSPTSRAATALTRWISRRTSATAPRIRRHSASVSSGPRMARRGPPRHRPGRRAPARSRYRATRAAACRSARRHCRRSGYVGVLRLVEPAGGQRHDVVDGLARLAPGGASPRPGARRARRAWPRGTGSWPGPDRLRCRGCAARSARRTAAPPAPAGRRAGRAGRAGW